MNVPDDLKYADTHEWARLVDDGTVTLGISDFAQGQLGDVVFIGLPAVGATVTAGEPFGEIESTKSVSDLYAPVTGEVASVNGALGDAPERVNADPYGEGWMIVIRAADVSSLDRLMDAAAYRAFVET
ncbi:MAG TPA: glycine cleavage system protein GcvH [Acidimicrobiia bacterium]